MDLYFPMRMAEERQRQRDQWGDAHDDQHYWTTWSHILGKQYGKVAGAIENVGRYSADVSEIRYALVELAATAQAFDEAIERIQGAVLRGEDIGPVLEEGYR